jgi:hypothetical protein
MKVQKQASMKAKIAVFGFMGFAVTLLSVVAWAQKGDLTHQHPDPNHDGVCVIRRGWVERDRGDFSSNGRIDTGGWSRHRGHEVIAGFKPEEAKLSSIVGTPRGGGLKNRHTILIGA